MAGQPGVVDLAGARAGIASTAMTTMVPVGRPGGARRCGRRRRAPRPRRGCQAVGAGVVGGRRSHGPASSSMSSRLTRSPKSFTIRLTRPVSHSRPVAVEAAEVAGGQHPAELVGRAEVGAASGVAKHDVGSGVDHLADPALSGSAIRSASRAPAGRPTRPGRAGQRGRARTSGRRLRLAVHHEQPAPGRGQPLVDLHHDAGSTSTGLGQAIAGAGGPCRAGPSGGTARSCRAPRGSRSPAGRARPASARAGRRCAR